MSDSITVRSRLGDYPVFFHRDLDFLSELAALPNPAVLVDRRVAELYGDTLESAFGSRPIYQLEAREENKTLAAAGDIYEWLVTDFAAKKNLNFISIGGGITQDVSGFVASTLYRGINWTFVPTTLLAQADSCIGGKTSLNFHRHKNLLGTFYPPRQVHIAAAFAETLSELDLYSGYGEIIKFLLMRKFESNENYDVSAEMNRIAADFSGLNETIRTCLNIKRSFMEEDEFDRGRRNLLNYGHCFGHALESASNYYVPHGIAVNIGIIFANCAAVRRGTLAAAAAAAVTRDVNLPFLRQPQRREDYRAEPLLANLKNDKKRTGNGLPLVIPASGSLVRLNDFSEAEFEAVLNDVKEIIFNSDRGA